MSAPVTDVEAFDHRGGMCSHEYCTVYSGFFEGRAEALDTAAQLYREGFDVQVDGEEWTS